MEGSHGQPSCGKQYLCYFLHRLLDYRIPEFEALASMHSCSTPQLAWQKPYGEEGDMMPFYKVHLPSDEVAHKVAHRSMLTKALIEVWGEGASWEELQASIQQYPQELMAPWLREEISFKVVVDTYGGSMTMEEQVTAINRLAFIPFLGKVKLRNPEHTFWLVVCDCQENRGLPCSVPYYMWFGRCVGSSNRDILNTYTLKKRLYLGPTSMDTEMAFIMCNMAKVQRSQFVYDPFAGTGSILVAAAAHHAKVLGADLDLKVIRDGKEGKKKGQPPRLTVEANFQQYGFELPVGLLRMDAHRHPFSQHLQDVFHAIICDPPYGVRAGGKKSVPKDHPIRDPATHIPSMDPYTLGECLRDLLDFSARTLVIGGRLVYFLPATPDTFSEDEIPQHPALQLVSRCEQMLTRRYSRHLITMEKVRPYDAHAAAEYHASKPDPTMAIDRIHELVYECYRDENGKVIEVERPALNDAKFRGKFI